MNRKYRLTRSTDFKRVRRLGKSYAHPLVVLIALRNDDEAIRLGVAAGRSVGGAVERNRAKRRIREVLHSMIPELTPGWDVVLLARQPITTATFPQVQEALQRLVMRARICKTRYDC